MTANQVATRRLGKTDLEVTPVGLGAWQFSKGKGMGGKFWQVLSQETIDEVVRVALEGGINWFDTAEVYGKGRSETALACALTAAGKKGGDVLVATKWWPVMRTAGSIRRTIDERLRCLGGFPIDLYQVHQPFSFSSVEAEMEAMADLVESGKIRAVGVSNYSATQMRRAHEALTRRGLTLASNQVRHSLMYRRIERNGILAAARELGISIISWSPLEQGLLTGRFHKDPTQVKPLRFMRRRMFDYSAKGLERSRPLVEGLEEIARRRDVTAAEVALNWLLHFYGETVVVIPGASKASQARSNLGAMNFQLSKDELSRLDELSRGYR